MINNVYVFAGPSLFGTNLNTSQSRDLMWLPPARRGDIEYLVEKHKTPGIIGLADGTFHSYPSVSHVELREAIEAGWRIYGLCSMGAIRASEMSHMGILPWGTVAEMFCKNENMADDEVALLHDANPPYSPLSEPLIHLREFCNEAVRKKLLTVETSDAVIESLRQRWYGERTIKSLCIELNSLNVSTETREKLFSLTDDFGPFRIKQADLVSFVSNRPWTEWE